MIRLFVMILFFPFVSIAQDQAFSGSWALEKKISLTGKDYANAVPKKILIKQSASILINSIYENPNGDTSIYETLTTDGVPVKQTTSSGRPKITVNSASNANEQFEQKIVIYSIDGKDTSRITQNKWNLINNGQNIELIKDVYNIENKEHWSIKATYGRSGFGIKFKDGSWESIVELAKAQNKFIFIDCYASWCIPCKKMDMEVFSLQSVGNFMNDNFISVKLQFDTTKNDNELIRARYGLAKELKQKYAINAYPSYLFFSPEGKIVHRSIGYSEGIEFLRVAKSATNISSQYYTVLENYKKGIKSYSNLDTLALYTKIFGDQKIANVIAEDYWNYYLSNLSADEFYCQRHIKFATRDFVNPFYKEGSKGKVFQFLLKNPFKVDSIMNIKGYSSFYILNVINNENVLPALYKDGKPVKCTPNWQAISESIKKRYPGFYHESIIYKAQFSFYKKSNDWHRYAKLVQALLKKSPPKPDGKQFSALLATSFNDSWEVSAFAWDIFENCSIKKLLKQALKWSEMALALDRSSSKEKLVLAYFDTKAQILYKLNRVKEALECEQRAADLYLKYYPQKTTSNFHMVLDQMRRGERTWQN